MSSSRPWVKVWETWWKSRSHDDLDAHALLVGLRLLSVAQAAPEHDGDEDTRWCLNPAGEPKSLAGLARECRLTVGQAAKAIVALTSVGTIVQREDGAVGFPKWAQYQLSPRALRYRKANERQIAAPIAAQSAGKTDGKVPARGTEDRGQIPASQDSPKAPKRRSVESELEDDLPPGLVDTVLGAMQDAVRMVTKGRDRGPRDTPGNRALIRKLTRREQATLDDWRHVIAAQADNVRHRPETWKYLALSTLTRQANWLRLLDAPRARSLTRGPVDPSTQNHHDDVPF